MSDKQEVTRRGYVKYAAAGVVVVAGAAAGAYYTTRPGPGPIPTTTFTGSPTASTSTKPPKEEAVVACAYSYQSFDPAKDYTYWGGTVAMHMYDPLVTIRAPDYKAIPWLAERWEKSPDGYTYKFYLRKGIEFVRTGNPFNAEAAKFALDRFMKMGLGSSWILTQTMTLDSIKVLDEYTLQMNLTRPYAPFVTSLTAQGAMMVDPAVMEHEKDGDMGSAWLEDHSMGTGAYVMKSNERLVKIVLEANPDFWRSPPKIRKLTYMNVPETVDQRMMLEGGDIDVALETLPEDWKRWKTNPDIKLIENRSFWTIHMIMHTGREGTPLRDVRVRQAIRCAINYDEIISFLALGFGERTSGPMRPGMPGFDEALDKELWEKYDAYNPEKARRLLNEAGFPNGLGPLNLMIGEGALLRVVPTQLAEKIKSDLEKVGITTNILQVTQSAMQAYYYDGGGGFDMILGQTGFDFPDVDNWMSFGYHSEGPFCATYIKGVANPSTDQLLEDAAEEQDPEKRWEMYREFERWRGENDYMVWPFGSMNVTAMSSRLKGTDYSDFNMCTYFHDAYFE